PVKEPGLRQEVFKAYNDWSGEFNSLDPDRLSNLAVIPNHDGQAAANEIQRVAKIGHRGAYIDHFNMPVPMYDDCWEPMWQAAEDTELSIAVHLGGGTYMLPRKIGSWVMTARVSVVTMQLDEVLAVVCLSGILERHPKLNIVLGESGLGWIPYVLEKMDEKYKEYATNTRDYRGEIKPTDLFHRQVFATFEEEVLGVDMIPLIGADSIMWASDYPHPDSTWPNSVDYVQKALSGLTEEDRRRILWGNAAKVYHVKDPIKARK
ncbi:amidohydrolase, partial [Dehalococcoidia bacterium]|nr:amidohydrolase [Dehalococcoidia bacterium]